MRILIFTSQLRSFRSGVGTYAHGLVSGLARLGHPVTVVAPEDQIGGAAAARGIPVRGVPIDPSPGHWLSIGAAFARTLGRYEQDHDVAHFTDAREACFVRGPAIPVTAMVNDAYALDWLELTDRDRAFHDRVPRSAYYRLLRFVERRTYHRLSGLMANSEFVARTVESGYRLASESVTVVRYGLPDLPDPEPVHLTGSPKLLFVGGNFQRKGLPLLLEAVAQLLPEQPNLQLHVVGRDRNQAKMSQLAGQLGILDAVNFHGWQPNDRVRALMASADVFVLPSVTEGFGLVYLEAMKAGTPVIATRKSGVAEVGTHGSDIMFVVPGDREQLRDTIQHVLSNEALADRLRQNGLALARTFTPDMTARATMAVIEVTVTAQRLRQ